MSQRSLNSSQTLSIDWHSNNNSNNNDNNNDNNSNNDDDDMIKQSIKLCGSFLARTPTTTTTIVKRDGQLLRAQQNQKWLSSLFQDCWLILARLDSAIQSPSRTGEETLGMIRAATRVREKKREREEMRLERKVAAHGDKMIDSS